MLTPADAVSVLNGVLGLTAIFLISLNLLDLAVLLILFAVLADGLDGFVARMGYGGGPFGPKLDSFNDFVSFGVAPATLIFHRYYQWEIVTEVSGPSILTAMAVGAAAGAFLVAGMLRLIRFEVIRGDTRSDFFTGLSIPAAALWVTLGTYMGWEPRVVLAFTWLAAFLMVSRIKFPKVRGPLVVPLALAVLGTIWFGRQFDQSAPRVLFSIMTTYVAMGPLFVRWRAGRLTDMEHSWTD